jgi:S1-C subfamily serine protease
MSAIEEIQAVIAGAAERIGPSVVGLGRGWHGGSGVVIGDDLVLTAAHNLRRDEVTLTFADGRRAASETVAVDAHRDLAVLSAETQDLPAVPPAPDQAPSVGAPVVALANPGGRGLRVTFGFVSAANRSFRGGPGRRVTGCIEHTAPLPRGSSGSPIVDPEGRLLGLNAVRLEGGLIVAVPAEPKQVEALTRGESVRPPRLGVAVAPTYVGRRLRRAVGLPERDGVLVRSVEADSAAARAGIEQGDLIVAAAGQPVDGIDALFGALDRVKEEGTLELTVVRGTEERNLAAQFETPDREEANR